MGGDRGPAWGRWGEAGRVGRSRQGGQAVAHLDLRSLHFGSLQHLDELHVIHRVTLGGAEPVQDLVFYVLQLLAHLGITDNQLVLGFLQVGSLLSHYLA